MPGKFLMTFGLLGLASLFFGMLFDAIISETDARYRMRPEELRAWTSAGEWMWASFLICIVGFVVSALVCIWS